MTDDSHTPQDLGAIERQAHALVDRRRYAQARDLVNLGLKDFPDSTELQYLAAFIDYVDDHETAAMTGVRDLLAHAPEHYGARVLLAHLLEDSSQLAAAERVWIDLLRDYPEDADCYGGYGKLILKALNWDKARRLAAEGLRRSPENADCLYLASIIDLIQNRRGANLHLQRLLQEHPGQSRSAMALIATLSARGNERAALKIAQELLRNQPDSPRLVALVRALKASNHWSLLPLYPMRRWGWSGAAAVTLVGITVVQVSQRTLSPRLAGALAGLWLAYVIYSWTWPKLLRRWI
jgi:tetratricopeptide (TPR) repeat protein